MLHNPPCFRGRGPEIDPFWPKIAARCSLRFFSWATFPLGLDCRLTLSPPTDMRNIRLWLVICYLCHKIGTKWNKQNITKQYPLQHPRIKPIISLCLFHDVQHTFLGSILAQCPPDWRFNHGYLHNFGVVIITPTWFKNAKRNHLPALLKFLPLGFFWGGFTHFLGAAFTISVGKFLRKNLDSSIP